MKLFPEIAEIMREPGDMTGSGLSFYGLFGAGKALFVKELLENTDKKIVFTAKSELSGADLYRDMCFLIGSENVVMPDASEYMIYDAMPSGNASQHNRIKALIKMYEGDYKVAVITPALLMERLPEAENLKRATLTILKGEEYDLPGISEKLSRMGYTKVPRAEEQGQFSQRGDILDIFPY